MQAVCIALVTLAVSGTAASGASEKESQAAKSDQSQEASALKLMSSEREDRLRRMLPRVADTDLQKILDDRRLILYTDKEIPRAYQFWSGDLQGVHLASYNISANDSEPHGNGNLEFPWGHPAGTHRSKGVEAFRFLWLPRDDQGHVRPVVWYRKRLPGDGTTGYAWTFPVGAIVGEVLAMPGPDEYAYTFEMRVRTREYGYWDVNLYRPFPTAADLARRIKELRPNWQDEPKLAKAVEHLEQPLEMRSHTLADKHPAKQTFEQTMGIDTLPSLGDDQLVAELLTSTEFRSATGEVWRESGNGIKTYAPTTAADFHIVPANYDAGFVQVDRTSCMRCHDSVARPVSEFQGGRDWYGQIRGSDAIFSFHPFAIESISDNGYGRTVHMRSELEEAGVIAQYDPEKHPNTIYHALDTRRK